MHILHIIGWGCRLITCFVRALAYTTQDPLTVTRKWEWDVGRELTDKEWDRALIPLESYRETQSFSIDRIIYSTSRIPHTGNITPNVWVSLKLSQMPEPRSGHSSHVLELPICRHSMGRHFQCTRGGDRQHRFMNNGVCITRTT